MKKVLITSILLSVLVLPSKVYAEPSKLTQQCLLEAMNADPQIAKFRLTNAKLVDSKEATDGTYHLLFMHTNEDPDTQIQTVIKQSDLCSVASIDPGGDGVDLSEILPQNVATDFTEASKLFWQNWVQSRN